MTAKKPNKKKPSVDAVLKAIRDSGRALDTSELATELLKAFGGAQEFAASFRQEFNDAPAGGIAKVKMLESVLRIVGQAAAKNKEALANLQDFTDDELGDMLNQVVNDDGEEESKGKG